MTVHSGSEIPSLGEKAGADNVWAWWARSRIGSTVHSIRFMTAALQQRVPRDEASISGLCTNLGRQGVASGQHLL